MLWHICHSMRIPWYRHIYSTYPYYRHVTWSWKLRCPLPWIKQYYGSSCSVHLVWKKFLVTWIFRRRSPNPRSVIFRDANSNSCHDGRSNSYVHSEQANVTLTPTPKPETCLKASTWTILPAQIYKLQCNGCEINSHLCCQTEIRIHRETLDV